MLVSNPLIRAAMTVGVFWWLALTVIAVWKWPQVFFSLEGPPIVFWYLVRAAKALVGAAAIGCVLVCGWHMARYFRTLKALRSDRLRGMTCSVGPLPLIRSGLPQVEVIPEWMREKDRVEHGGAILAWLSANEKEHPEHARLLSTLLRALCLYKELPASPDQAEHGGRSLLDHSIRVAVIALEDAKQFKIPGLQTSKGLVPWRDPKFVVNPQDPMIPIIGLAHDIGKIETYELDTTGKVVNHRAGHDKVGARLLALLDEVHALPAGDRAALFKSIAHHHSPLDFPLAKDGHLEDDRAAAMLMLLAHSDEKAKKAETADMKQAAPTAVQAPVSSPDAPTEELKNLVPRQDDGSSNAQAHSEQVDPVDEQVEAEWQDELEP